MKSDFDVKKQVMELEKRVLEKRALAPCSVASPLSFARTDYIHRRASLRRKRAFVFVEKEVFRKR